MPTPTRQTLVPDPDRLRVLSLAMEGDAITLTVQTCGETATAQCPSCGRLSACVHSHYHRARADVLWQGIPAPVSRWSRRFFCDSCDASDCRAASSPSVCQALLHPMRVAPSDYVTGCSRWPSCWAASRERACCNGCE